MMATMHYDPMLNTEITTLDMVCPRCREQIRICVQESEKDIRYIQFQTDGLRRRNRMLEDRVIELQHYVSALTKRTWQEELALQGRMLLNFLMLHFIPARIRAGG